MKKNVWSKLLCMTLVLMMVFSLAACGKKTSKSSAAGTYNLQEISAAGITMNMEDLKATLGDAAKDLTFAIVLGEDGKFSLDMTAFDPSLSLEGTWEEKDGSIALTADGETINAPLKDGTLTLEADGTSMTFKK
ncbi:MAG: hypothetical protein HFI93_08200 [Lachnospiraceae bacterium]|nr:hypothetical protein [Lachnospiraceae bacterium]